MHFIRAFLYTTVYLLIRLFDQAFIYFLFCWHNDSFGYSFSGAHLFIQSFIHPLIQCINFLCISLAHSLTKSLTQTFSFFSEQMVDRKRDSPLLMYSVTVTHGRGSPCDAHDVLIYDETKNLDVHRSSVVPRSNVLVRYPSVYTFVLTYKIPVVKGKLAAGLCMYFTNTYHTSLC